MSTASSGLARRKSLGGRLVAIWWNVSIEFNMQQIDPCKVGPHVLHNSTIVVIGWPTITLSAFN